jgi:hypothetical protein
LKNVRNLRRRLAVARTLDSADWRTMAEAVTAVIVADAALRVMPFPKVVAWASRPSRAAHGVVPAILPEVVPGAVSDVAPGAAADRVARIARFVAFAGRVTRRRCLPRSLALTRLLARRGVRTTLRIGVRPEGGALRAHAWVEWIGRALNDDAHTLGEFAPFERVLDGTHHA